MENYNKQAETNLLEAIKQKEESDKRLLKMEVVIMIIALVFLLSMFTIAILSFEFLSLPIWGMITMMVVGFLTFLAAAFISLRIEQKAGYYECQKCGHRYVPTSYWKVFFAPHLNTSRFLKCPKCGKRNYHKKVISEKE